MATLDQSNSNQMGWLWVAGPIMLTAYLVLTFGSDSVLAKFLGCVGLAAFVYSLVLGLRIALRRKRYSYWAGAIIPGVFTAGVIVTITWGSGGVLIPLALLALVIFGSTLAYRSQNPDRKEPGARITVEYGLLKPQPDTYTREQEASMLKDPYYDRVVYVYIGIFFAGFLGSIVAAGVVGSIWYAALLGILWGFMTGPFNEIYSHEFVHRRSLFQQMLGGSVWATFCYGTFLAEHPMGHHKHVSTPEDASSAAKGDTIYKFIPRAALRNPVAGFKLEAERLRKESKPVIGVHNRLLWLSAFTLSIILFSYAVSGVYGLVFFALQTILGIMVIETANYIMHYGLRRKQLADGSYERVSPLHSWNREGLESLPMANLTRHSDHHAFGRRPYPILRHFEESPELPVGYDVLLVAAYVPKWFHFIMDPVVDETMEKLKRWQDEGIDDYKRVMGIDNYRGDGTST